MLIKSIINFLLKPKEKFNLLMLPVEVSCGGKYVGRSSVPYLSADNTYIISEIYFYDDEINDVFQRDLISGKIKQKWPLKFSYEALIYSDGFHVYDDAFVINLNNIQFKTFKENDYVLVKNLNCTAYYRINKYEDQI